MPLPASTKAQLQIHCCVMLWGFTAILGKLITLGALALVWWRMLIVAVVLLLVPRVWRGLRAMPPRLLAGYAGCGVLIALHWLTFYGAIKLANASVGAICIAIAPVFLAVVEPWVARRRFDLRELLLGVGVVPGVALVMGGVPAGMYVGLGVGVLSALFMALFSACNKRLVEQADPVTVTCIEVGAGTAFLTLLAPLLPHTGPAFVWPDLHDAVLLLVMALGCTLLPFVMVLSALRQVSAFALQIATNLEPVYAIVLAIAVLGEQRELDPLFYLGVAVVLASVFVHPWLSRRRSPLPAAELLGTAGSTEREKT